MRILALLILCLMAATAQALPTVEDVEHAVHRGDYTAAESMTREVLAAKPDNAKAHYLLAELLAHEGKLGEARTQAASAQQLDPAIHFTTPERFRQFQAQLGGAGKARPPATSARGTTGAALSERAGEASSSGGGVSMTWIIVLLGIGAIFLFMRAAVQQHHKGMPATIPRRRTACRVDPVIRAALGTRTVRRAAASAAPWWPDSAALPPAWSPNI
jgi:tetratricopeptide (TPR) repeat protein